MSNLTPEERQRIYEEEKARLEAQEQLKREAADKSSQEAAAKKKAEAARVQKAFGVVVILIIVMVLVWTLSNPAPPTTQPAAAPAAAASAVANNDPALTFYVAAASYLGTANAQGLKVAQKMAGATDGSSTLSDIKAAISAAIRVENAGYEGDYRARRGPVPSGGAAFAKDVEETHRLFQAAMNEYLEYWKDQNIAHITSGELTLKKCITLMNKTIAAGTAKMKGFPSK